MNRKVRAFVERVKRGEIVKPLYLTYYNAYLAIYDRRHGTNFSNSQAPHEMGSEQIGGTGNFPAHPKLVRKFLRAANLERDAAFLDVGHGSGIVLYVASELNFTNLSGVEYGKVPYELSTANVGDKATLMRGNALDTISRRSPSSTSSTPSAVSLR